MTGRLTPAGPCGGAEAILADMPVELVHLAADLGCSFIAIGLILTPRYADLCFPGERNRSGKQISRARDTLNLFSFLGKTGAGEGIRTLDPNLGMRTLRPRQTGR